MSLSIGIVGLPNVGKSTLFNALTDASVLAANYPFATIEPNTGVVPVPDARLAKLSEIYASAPIKPANVTFVDIAGLVAGASKGEGLGNQFLGHIRSTNAICQVVRVFDDPNVVRTSASEPQASGLDGVQGAGEQRTEPYIKYGEGAAAPATPQSAKNASRLPGKAGQPASVARGLRDIEVINTELILADLQTLERYLPKLAKEVKADPKLKSKLELLEKVKQGLDEGKLAGSFLAHDELATISDLQLLSAKPFIIVFNLDENQLADAKLQEEFKALVSPCSTVFLSAKLESELTGLDASDRIELLASYGQNTSGLGLLASAAYQALGLQSFLTAGEKEVRAWTIAKGASAPEAAGVIHKDFERGFIAAEIVSYNDLLASGSPAAAKSAGKVRTEGKNYLMKPNDVVEFRFNVSK